VKPPGNAPVKPPGNAPDKPPGETPGETPGNAPGGFLDVWGGHARLRPEISWGEIYESYEGCCLHQAQQEAVTNRAFLERIRAEMPANAGQVHYDYVVETDALHAELVKGRPAPDPNLADAGTLALRDTAWIYSCKAKTGRHISHALRKKAGDLKGAQMRHDYALAAKLRAAGVSPFRKSPSRNACVGLFSGLAEEFPAFRNLNLFAHVARRRRNKTHKALLAWFSSKRRRAATAHVLVTSGPRVPLDERRTVKARFTWLTRKISKLNDAPWMRRLGVQVIMRSSETGDLVERVTLPGGAAGWRVIMDAAGRVLVHVHAHILLYKSRWLTCDEADELKQRLEGHFKTYCGFDRPVENPREIVKYVTKTADLAFLSPAQLKLLHENMYRGRHCTPLGVLKARIPAGKGFDFIDHGRF
jgi:hypothetical protein